MSILLKILNVLCIYILGRLLEKLILFIFIARNHYKEKHFCNDCQGAFVTRLTELGYKYCPYCGKPLDYHEKDERSLSYKGDED